MLTLCVWFAVYLNATIKHELIANTILYYFQLRTTETYDDSASDETTAEAMQAVGQELGET